MMKTTQEVAERYAELFRQNNFAEIQSELFGDDIVNIEPEHVTAFGLPQITKGLDAVLAKGIAGRKMIEAIHEVSCSNPIVSGNFFSAVLSRDLTLKDKPRIVREEIAVFEVKNGKIIKEQFFY